MSRTYRRKGQYEIDNCSWSRSYCRLYPDGVEYDYRTGLHYPMDKEKALKRKVKFHSDNYSTVMNQAPSWFNNIFERKFRNKNKLEIKKWMKNSDYEPMCYENPPSTLWEWV